MKCIRFEANGNKRIGFIDGDVVRTVYGSLETFWRITDEVFRLEDVKLLAPCVPKQIICVGFNYRSHAEEFHAEVPKEPMLFSKAAHTIIGDGAAIVYPWQSKEVVYEAELGVVIKKRMRNVKPEDVKDYILGYTCANDVTARDLQLDDVQWLRSKSFDTFCPLGPWLETDLDPTDLSIKTYLNGELKQNGRTSDMVYNPYEILSYISESMTLDAGDLVLTGTPFKVKRKLATVRHMFLDPKDIFVGEGRGGELSCSGSSRSSCTRSWGWWDISESLWERTGT